MVFLLHVRSALVAILMLPVGVLIAFIAMRLLGHELQPDEPGRHRHRHRAMIDAAIVMIENAHKHLGAPAGAASLDRGRAMLAACRRSGRRCSSRC